MRLSRLVPDDLDTDQARLYRAITQGDRARGEQSFDLIEPDGALPGPYGVMLQAPGIGGPLQELGAALRFHASLSDRQREIVILMATRGPGSPFAWWAHDRIARTIGLQDHEITAIAEGTFEGRDPAESALCAFVASLLAGGEVSEEVFARASARFEQAELVEVSVLVGYYRMLKQTMTAFQVGLPTAEDPDAH